MRVSLGELGRPNPTSCGRWRTPSAPVRGVGRRLLFLKAAGILTQGSRPPVPSMQRRTALSKAKSRGTPAFALRTFLLGLISTPLVLFAWSLLAIPNISRTAMRIAFLVVPLWGLFFLVCAVCVWRRVGRARGLCLTASVVTGLACLGIGCVSLILLFIAPSSHEWFVGAIVASLILGVAAKKNFQACRNDTLWKLYAGTDGLRPEASGGHEASETE